MLDEEYGNFWVEFIGEQSCPLGWMCNLKLISLKDSIVLLMQLSSQDILLLFTKRALIQHTKYVIETCIFML